MKWIWVQWGFWETRERERNTETKNSLVYYRMCYFPAGNGEAEVKDNNKSVGEGRRWRRMGEGEERRGENKQEPDRDKKKRRA